jgi:hypothetical protein
VDSCPYEDTQQRNPPTNRTRRIANNDLRRRLSPATTVCPMP